jgi:hypothetical protein
MNIAKYDQPYTSLWAVGLRFPHPIRGTAVSIDLIEPACFENTRALLTQATGTGTATATATATGTGTGRAVEDI